MSLTASSPVCCSQWLSFFSCYCFTTAFLQDGKRRGCASGVSGDTLMFLGWSELEGRPGAHGNSVLFSSIRASERFDSTSIPSLHLALNFSLVKTISWTAFSIFYSIKKCSMLFPLLVTMWLSLPMMQQQQHTSWTLTVCEAVFFFFLN